MLTKSIILSEFNDPKSWIEAAVVVMAWGITLRGDIVLSLGTSKVLIVVNEVTFEDGTVT